MKITRQAAIGHETQGQCQVHCKPFGFGVLISCDKHYTNQNEADIIISSWYFTDTVDMAGF